MTLSKEKLAHYAMHTDGPVKAMTRELLERRGRDKQEPDGWQFLGVNGLWVSVTENGMREALKEGCEVRPLYAAPQLPQPAVDESAIFDAAIDVCRNSDSIDEHAWNHGVLAVMSSFRHCRAAMLQGAEPVIQPDELPMGYHHGHKDGLEWAARLAESNHPQTGDWLYDDPLELAKAIRKGPDMPTASVQKLTFREALAAIRNLGPIDAEKIQAERDALNEPVQDWIACSERLPEEIGRYWCYVEEQNSLGKSHYQWNCSWNGDRWWVESENGGRVTHWMPLPVAPQQEA